MTLKFTFHLNINRLNQLLLFFFLRVKLEGHGKLTAYEYVSAFLKLHGLLHSNSELETAEKLVQILTTSLTAHIATESLSSWKLVQVYYTVLVTPNLAFNAVGQTIILVASYSVF